MNARERLERLERIERELLEIQQNLVARERTIGVALVGEAIEKLRLTRSYDGPELEKVEVPGE